MFVRDCLAAPGTTVADTGVPVGNPNKNKTCYKCQQEGHVSDRFSPRHAPTDWLCGVIRLLATAPRTPIMPPKSLTLRHRSRYHTIVGCQCIRCMKIDSASKACNDRCFYLSAAISVFMYEYESSCDSKLVGVVWFCYESGTLWFSAARRK